MEVDQDKVDELLKSSKAQYEKLGDINVPKEVQESIQPKEEEKPPEAPAPEIKVPADPVFDPNAVTQPKVAFWRSETPDVGTVEVTDMDKTLYLKAVLNDVPLELDIDVNGIKVRVRSRNLFETDLIFKALHDDEEKGFCIGPVDFTSRMQQYSGALQVLSFGDSKLEPFTGYDTSLPVSVAIDALREHTKKHIVGINEVRWAVMVTALRTFVVKEHICTNNIANKNFWKLAGTV